MKAHKWRGYLIGAALVGLASVLSRLGHQFVSPVNMIMVYLLVVVVTASFWGFGPSIMASILSVLAFDFFFVPPFLTFTVDDTQYIFTFIVLLVTGMLVSYLTSQVRLKTEAAKQRERQTSVLYALSRDLAIATDLASYIRAIGERVRETFGCEAVVFLPDSPDKRDLKPVPRDKPVSDTEFAAAALAFQSQQGLGPGSGALPEAAALVLSLVTARGAVGVIVLRAGNSKINLTPEQERLLRAFADLMAVAIEGILLAEETRNMQVLKATERLQTALLNAISHDLRTPMVSIIGVLSSLQDRDMVLDDSTRNNLIQVARQEAERLNHLISNLLDESRIEAGALRISRQPSDIQDLVGAALEQLGKRASGFSVQTDIPADLPFLNVDFGLTVQALVNILDNAVKYSPSGSPVEVSVRKTGGMLHIEIGDRGAGIPPQDLLRVFDKFYRIQRPDNVAGTGLGLAICKGIIEAHGGHVMAENRSGGGTLIRIVLPVREPVPNRENQLD